MTARLVALFLIVVLVCAALVVRHRLDRHPAAVLLAGGPRVTAHDSDRSWVARVRMVAGPDDSPPMGHHGDRPRLHLTVTAYCATGYRTASGVWPQVGMAAANAYAFGTRLLVAGVGVVTVTDRSAPGATDVDLFMGSAGCEQRALAFGRRDLAVTVLP